MLILRQQANVIIDQRGRARLTEYGLAPINSDPSFTVAATPGAVGNSRWLAPEIISPSYNRAGMPVTESKAADAFAFAMLAVEVFTGKVPFQDETPTVAASCVRRGERPVIPQNAEQLGLTREMWKFLESCWHQDPKKRPTMKNIVRRWRGFVEHENDRVVNTPSSSWIPSRDRIRKTPPAVGPNCPRPEDNQPTPSELSSQEGTNPKH